MAGMFGLIVSGRLVQTDFTAVSDTKFAITVPEADSINHVVVFLTGSQPFPNDIGGAVYFSWPSPDGAPMWYFLGAITNQKPSAIFKISGLKGETSHQPQNFFTQQFSHDAQIGISAEPLTVLSGLTPATNDSASAQNWQLEFGQAMCEHLHNFAGSYARPMAQLPSAGFTQQETFVPMSAVVSWYNSFSRRLQQNANFWRK